MVSGNQKKESFMKKITMLMMVLVVLFGIGFTSCDTDGGDDGNNGGGGSTPTFECDQHYGCTNHDNTSPNGTWKTADGYSSLITIENEKITGDPTGSFDYPGNICPNSLIYDGKLYLRQ